MKYLNYWKTKATHLIIEKHWFICYVVKNFMYVLIQNKKIISFLISHLCVATINYYMVYSQVYKWMIIFSSYPTAIAWIFPEKITIDDRTVCLFYQLFIVLYFITLICLVQTDWLSSLILWYEWSSQIDFKKQLSVFARQVSKTMHFSDQNNYKNMVNKNITKENINYQ